MQLDTVAAACGIIFNHEDGFRHLATAWHVGEGDWMAAWCQPERPADPQLLLVASGAVVALHDWEQDGHLLGFRSQAIDHALPLGDQVPLHKRMPLEVIAYPSVIDHPCFQLHRGSLDGARYWPYLCPKAQAGHLSLISADHGFVTATYHRGMQGGPVMDAQGRVVGVIESTPKSSDLVDLIRFRRLHTSEADNNDHGPESVAMMAH